MDEREAALEELGRSVLAEARDDYVGLWSVLWTARRLLPGTSPADVREIVLRLLGQFLSEGLVVPGEPTEDGLGFIQWPEGPTAALEKIRREWATLGRDPRLGDVVWITTPLERPI